MKQLGGIVAQSPLRRVFGARMTANALQEAYIKVLIEGLRNEIALAGRKVCPAGLSVLPAGRSSSQLIDDNLGN